MINISPSVFTGSRASCPCPQQAWFTQVPCPWRGCPHPRCPLSTQACPAAPNPTPTTTRSPTCPAWRGTSHASRRRSCGWTTAMATRTTSLTTRTKRPTTPAITRTISPNRTPREPRTFKSQSKLVNPLSLQKNPKPTNQEEELSLLPITLSPNLPKTCHPLPTSLLTWTLLTEPDPNTPPPSHRSPDTSIWSINWSTGPVTHTDCYTNRSLGGGEDRRRLLKLAEEYSSTTARVWVMHQVRRKKKITLRKSNLLDPVCRRGDVLKTKHDGTVDLSKGRTDDTLRWRTCLLSRDTFKEKKQLFLFFGSIIFSLRYTVPISGLWMWFVVFVLQVWIIIEKRDISFPPILL